MSKHTDTSRSGDLVGRLRRTYPDYYNPARASTGTAISPASMLLVRERLLNPDGPEAADRIEALEAENERLRGALYKIQFTATQAFEPEEPPVSQAGSEA